MSMGNKNQKLFISGDDHNNNATRVTMIDTVSTGLSYYYGNTIRAPGGG